MDALPTPPGAFGPRDLPGFLGDVERALRDELRASDASAPDGRRRLASAAQHLALAGEAKRARPSLCFTLARAVAATRTVDASVLTDAAVGVELIHTASLLHDDVVDDDTVRRGRPTVNAREGNIVAVLTGDFVLARAMRRLRAQPALLIRGLGVVEEMTVAALIEVEARGDAGFSEAGWRAMAAGKTGALFGLCGAAAALAAGDAERADRFFQAGVHLGVAFQIADDVDDLPGGGDLREQNPSFPVAAAAARSPRVRASLDSAWSAERAGASEEGAWRGLIDDVIAAGGLGAAIDAARVEVAEARRAFGPDLSHAAVGDVLAWADALVERAARRSREAA